MSITLKPDNQAWLEQQVKEGTFSSIDEALNTAVETLKTIHGASDGKRNAPHIVTKAQTLEN